MNKLVKGAFIFTGGVSVGFVACGIFAIRQAVKSESLREVVSKAVRKKVADYVSSIILGEKKPDKKPKSERQIIPEQLVFDTREKAEDILINMRGIIDKYGCLTLMDYYDMSGFSSTDYMTNNRYGWTDLSDARVVRIRSGYTIDLPYAIKLKIPW